MVKNTPKLRFPEFSGDWEEKKLGEIASIIGGGTPDTTKNEYWNGDINWLTPTEITKKYIKDSNRKITQMGMLKSSAKMLPENAILFTSRANIGDVGIAKCICTTNQGFQSFVCNRDLYYEFMYYLLMYNKKEFLSLASGSTFLEISKNILFNVNISLPSLPEQEKIGDFLSSVDKSIDILKRKKELLEKYKKGAMQKIFSQEIRFKDNNGKDYPDWEEKKLGEIGKFVGGGTPTTKNKYYWDGSIPWISSADLVEGKMYHINKTRFITKSAISNSATKLVPANSILIITRVGVGKVAIADEDLCTSQDFTNLVVNELNNSIFSGYLVATVIKKLLEFNQGTSIKGILKEDLQSLTISLPSLPEQQKIADFLSGIDNKIDIVSKKLENAELYKKSLLQQMFV